jgi:hypothetical protein
MGEFKVVPTTMPLNQAVMPITYPGPSTVLFQLLGLLIEAGKEIASIKDVLTGEGLGKNASPTTTLALIEQGLQVFTAIYKRIHRALSHELSLHAECNREHLDKEKYSAFFDQMQPAPADPMMQQGSGMPPMQEGMPEGGMPPGMPPEMAQQPPQMIPAMFDPAEDYNDDDMDIMPLSDPGAVTKMQKLSKADFIWTTAKDSGGIVNPAVALKRLYEAADIDNPEELFAQPDPETQELMKRGAVAEVAEKEGKAAKAMAEAEAIANAPAEPAAPQVDPIEAEKQVVIAGLEITEKQHKVRGAELDNLVKQADLATRDVEIVPDENGEDAVASRTMLGLQAIMEGLGQIAALVASQGQQQALLAEQQTQAINQVAEIVAAPNELVRDELTGRALGSRKVLPTIQ